MTTYRTVLRIFALFALAVTTTAAGVTTEKGGVR